jgi:hypothetical protein
MDDQNVQEEEFNKQASTEEGVNYYMELNEQPSVDL